MPQNPEAGDGEKSAVQSRCDVIHTLTLCEMSHFHDQRRHDFKLYMENFLQAQIEFHEAVGRGEGRGGGCASPIDVSPNPAPDCGQAARCQGQLHAAVLMLSAIHGNDLGGGRDEKRYAGRQ